MLNILQGVVGKMVDNDKVIKRSKPKFLRSGCHKKIKLGSSVKSVRKWRMPKGRQNKIRLNRKGHPQRPKIGWGAERGVRSQDLDVRIMNVNELADIKKGSGIVIGMVGAKKRKEIIAKANEMGIKILNKYKEATPSVPLESKK